MSNCSFHKTERECDFTCFPCTFMHGLEDGKGGLWATTKVPNKYKGARLENLPIAEENPKTYEFVTKYINHILKVVQEKQVGLYLYSIPQNNNPFGTGTGKTTTAVTILNHFVIERARQYFKGNQDMDDNPAVFIKVTELQNNFSKQFTAGTEQSKQEASIKFEKMSKQIKHTELVVLDDIATRGSRISEAFEEQLYELIDYRDTSGKGAIIFTSNVNMKQLTDVLGERIASRIAGMTKPIGFRGKDNRAEDLFN